MDSLTDQLVHEIERLPIRKKSALLELLRSDEPAAATSGEKRQAWKQSLLNTSVWTDDDLQPLREAHAWMNQWTPPSS